MRLTPEMLEGLRQALHVGGDSHTLADVFEAVALGAAQLWVEGDTCLVTEVNDTPQVRELHFWLATGALDDVIALTNKVMDWGRKQGCTVATLTGRFGWKKVMAREGWEPLTIQMARRL